MRLRAGPHDDAPVLRPLRLVVSLLVLVVAVYVGMWIAPGVWLEGTAAALLVAVIVAALSALLPPALAAVPLPYTAVLGFVGVLVLDGVILWLAAQALPDDVHVDSIPAGMLAAVLIAAVAMPLGLVLGVDDQAAAMVVLRRVARRQGVVESGDVPGIVFLEIDGLAAPVLRRAIAAGHVPHLQRWLDEEGYVLEEWEPDLSSQTGASQAGILLGSNDDVPAFRWVEKATGRVVACSDPKDCAMLEARLDRGRGLLTGGGTSRGNLLSGGADEALLTVSRLDAERRANPGYRAFLANGQNATRLLVLFGWEILLELLAAGRQRRRDIRPRGHRGGRYPLLRATMTVVVRDLVVFSVLTDMMRGRPAVYATFASYDEVAHHSGLERPDTLEALRKLDERFGRIAAARDRTPRPYEIVVLSDHGQTQGATFRQRNGEGLEDLVERSLSRGQVHALAGGDEQDAMVGHALHEAGAPGGGRGDGRDVSGREAVVLGSGNLGLVHLMQSPRRMTLEEIDARHPRLVDALRGHPHVGWLLVRSAELGPLVLGPRGSVRLDDGQVTGQDPLAAFGPSAQRHLRRTDRFEHCPDILVGSFYDPDRDEGCAFEELISFHGGLGGPQTRPFVLFPARLGAPGRRVVGAEELHDLLAGWRERLQGRPAVDAAPVPAGARAPA
jgi:uncharacterized membrane protein YvlD (DUF360 family)